MGTYSWHSLFELPGGITNLKKKKRRRRSKNSAGYAVDWYQWGVADPGAHKPSWMAEIQLCLAIWTWLVWACCCLNTSKLGKHLLAPTTAGEGSSHFWRSFLSLQEDTVLQTIKQCTLLSCFSFFKVGEGGQWGRGVLKFQKQTNK